MANRRRMEVSHVYQDLRAFISKLDEEGQLVRVHERLSPKFEIPDMIKYFTQTRNLRLFSENAEGYSSPVVANLVGTRQRLATAFGVSEVYCQLPPVVRAPEETRRVLR